MKDEVKPDPMKCIRKPIPRPGNTHASKRDYNRRVKHKKGDLNNENE